MANQFFFPAEIYQKRRQALMQKMGSGQVFLLGNRNVGITYADNYYPFRQDSNFLYYIGVNVPGLSAIIDCDKGETTLFGNDVTVESVVWTGPQPTMRELADSAAIENVLPKNKLETQLEKGFHYLPTYRAEQTLRIKELTRRKFSLKLVKSVIEQREIKGPEEVVEMEKAHTLSAQMQKLVMASAKPGMYEYELIAIASKFRWEHGCKWGYDPIMTVNGQTLHNHYYGNKIKEGDIVLYDGGIEVPSGYQADLTRSFPVSDKFTSLQKQVYEIVHAGYNMAVKKCKPNRSYKDIHLQVAEVMFEGLKDLGWAKGDTKEAIAAGAHTLFFPHGLGHMIGLDVHDMESFDEVYVGYTPRMKKSKEFGLKSLRLGKKLKAGFVITIEPGLYVIPQLIEQFKSEKKHLDFINYQEVEKHLGFGGIRIEDDFLITEKGNRVLGEPFGASVAEVEAVRTKTR